MYSTEKSIFDNHNSRAVINKLLISQTQVEIIWLDLRTLVKNNNNIPDMGITFETKTRKLKYNNNI